MNLDTAQLRSRIAAALETEGALEDGYPSENRPPKGGSNIGGPEHLDAEELIRYQAGEGSEAERERIQAHLTVCASCLEALLDLQVFVDAPRKAPTEADLETVSAWRSWKARRKGDRIRPLQALAAGLVLAVLGVGSWAWHQRGIAEELRKQVADLSRPQPNAPIVDLLPDSALRSSAARPPGRIPAGPGWVMLVMSLPQQPEVRALEAEIVDSGGSVVWKGSLEPSPHGTLRLGLPRETLAEGAYQIHLYRGERGERGERLRIESYALRVGREESADRNEAPPGQPGS